ncbi:hypothetical protein KXV85_002072, partial [Aspergillus fumigatus]
MRRALAAVIALAIAGAPIGVFLMLRRMRRGGNGWCRSRRGFQTPSARPIGPSSRRSATRRSGTSISPLQLPQWPVVRPDRRSGRPSAAPCSG